MYITMANKILIIGFGYVGQYLGALFLQKNIFFDVLDTNEKVKKNFIFFLKQQKQSIKKTNKLTFINYSQENHKYEYIILCLPTPRKKNKPDITSILDVRNKIDKFLSEKTCIILESTVYPGTTRNLLVNHFNSIKFIGYSSERVNPGDSIKLFSNTTKVISGKNKFSVNTIKKLYKKIFKKIYISNSMEVAESSKLLENTFRSINISLVNELKMILDDCNINIWEVINSAKTKEFGFMPFYPSIGFGGHCIPVDPLYLNWFFKKTTSKESMFIKYSHKLNDNLLKTIILKIKGKIKNFKNKNILLCGIAYKLNSDDLRESRSLVLAKKLFNLDANIYFYDQSIKNFNSNFFLNNKSFNFDEDIDFHCIVIINKVSNQIKSKILKSKAIIFDSTDQFNNNKNNKIIII